MAGIGTAFFDTGGGGCLRDADFTFQDLANYAKYNASVYNAASKLSSGGVNKAVTSQEEASSLLSSHYILREFTLTLAV